MHSSQQHQDQSRLAALRACYTAVAPGASLSGTGHYDMNYGVTLCIWDRLFGTHAPSDFVYPRTGIPDQDFPLETQRPAAWLPSALLVQLVYPFLKVMRKFGVPLIASGQRAKNGE